MSENFEQLVEQDLASKKLTPGTIIQGTVIGIENDFAIVDAGLKSEGIIPLDEFKTEDGELEIEIGMPVMCALCATRLTWKARTWSSRSSSWIRAATTSSFPAVPWLSQNTLKNAKSCWKACTMAPL